MNYELAKKLKDGGFPQENVFGTFFYDEKGNIRLGDEDWDLHLRAPSLSELIEECGDRFDTLTQGYYDEISGELMSGWHAGARIEVDDKYINTYGKTPEESVARLWLKLNKKNV